MQGLTLEGLALHVLQLQEAVRHLQERNTQLEQLVVTHIKQTNATNARIVNAIFPAVQIFSGEGNGKPKHEDPAEPGSGSNPDA